MKSIIKKIKQNKLNILIMIVYTIISIVILINHEPWRDEAQAWLIARDLNLIDIYKQMYYEGHPCLWHLIIFPFAKLQFPYFTINIISYLIMWITALLILTKAPFNKFIKLIIIFQAPIIYNYSAIARNYCLIPLALVLIANNYQHKDKIPIKYTLLILFLAWTHIIMSSMAAILSIQYFYEEIIKKRNRNKKIYLCLIITIIGFLLYVIPIGLGASQNNNLLISPLTESFHILKYISLKIFKSSKTIHLILTSIPILLFLLYELKYHKKNLLIFLITVSYQIYIYYNIYGISDQRCDVFIFIILFILWIQHNNIKSKKEYITMIIPLLLLLIAYSYSYNDMLNYDLNYPYSEAKATAKFINKNINNNSIFITQDMPETSAIIPYINKNQNIKFYGLEINDYFTYVTWDYKKQEQLNETNLINTITKKIKNENNLYIIANKEKYYQYQNLINNNYIKIIYLSNFESKETYCIYKVLKQS